MATGLVDVKLDDSQENTKRVIIPKPTLPLKYVYPKPVSLITQNGKKFIIIISGHQDGRCVGFDIEQDEYFKLGQYPDLKLSNHTISISSDYKYLYLFDGTKAERTYAVFEFDLNGDRPKIVNIKKSISKGRHTGNRNIVTAGKQIISTYIPEPWNEYHIFGGSLNNKHLKWATNQKRFVRVAETSNIIQQTINKQLIATEILFSVKQKQFILLGPNGTDQIWTLSYPSNKATGYWWIKSLIKLPYQQLQEFGAIFYQQQYIIIFGGYGMKTVGSRFVERVDQILRTDQITLNQLFSGTNKRQELNGIYILDMDSGKIQKSQILCPQNGRLYAVYFEGSERVHLFARYGEFRYWNMNLNAIVTQIEIEDINKVPLVANESKECISELNVDNMYNKNVPIYNFNDCKKHFDALYDQIVFLQNKIEILSKTKTNVMDVANDEKKSDEITFNEWLEENGVSEYEKLLTDEGVDDVYTLALLSEQELENMGVKKIGHRRKMLERCKNYRVK